MKKITIFISVILLIFCTCSFDSNALNICKLEASNDLSSSDIELIKGSKAGILIEKDTLSILYKKNIDLKLSLASMTKIMSLLLIFEAIDNDIISYDSILTCSSYAESMGGSQVYLEENEKMTLDEALKCICIASANDATVMVAEEICGSEDAFVSKMNQKAKELGCINTNFSDATGLESENHYSTAYDLAIISRELVTKYPKVLEYSSIKEDYIRKDSTSPFWLVNTNKLIGRVDGVVGLKTGYTSSAGYCITLLMEQNNMSLISVVFGYETATKRNSESLELLRYGFNTFKNDLVMEKNTLITSYDSICYTNKISVYLDNDIYYLCKRNESNSYSYEFEYDINTNSGKIYFYLDDKLIFTSNIKSNDEIIKKNYIVLVRDIIIKILS